MKLTIPLSSAIALRAAFYAVRGQFKLGEVTPPRFVISDGRTWLKLNKNIRILDGINSDWLETIKDLQAKKPSGDPQAVSDLLNAQVTAALAENYNLASLTPLTAKDLGLDINGDQMGQWANDMLDSFDQFLATSEPTTTEAQ